MGDTDNLLPFLEEIVKDVSTEMFLRAPVIRDLDRLDRIAIATAQHKAAQLGVYRGVAAYWHEINALWEADVLPTLRVVAPAGTPLPSLPIPEFYDPETGEPPPLYDAWADIQSDEGDQDE